MANEQKTPDFEVYLIDKGDRGKDDWYKVADAYRHGRGDGITIYMSARQNISGEIVLFPPDKDSAPGQTLRSGDDNRPDFYVYMVDEIGRQKDWHFSAKAYWHKSGGGLTIYMSNRQHLSGEIVLMPPKDDANSSDARSGKGASLSQRATKASTDRHKETTKEKVAV